MEDKSPEFMLEEYKQIANAYQDLHAQQNEQVKFYLTLVAVPASILAVVAQFMSTQTTNPDTISSISSIGLPIIICLLFALAIVGGFVVVSITILRCEALLYVRTVNCVRRYFVEHNLQGNLQKYLKLPDFDTFPPFYEGLKGRSFWTTFSLALVDSAVMFAAIVTLLNNIPASNNVVLYSLLLSICWLLLQVLVHIKLLNDEEKKYEVKFLSPFPNEKKIGIDLDGVLNDLAEGVIEKAKTEYGINIEPSQITSHKLQECTPLTIEQVGSIFTSTDIFSSVKPVSEARESLKQLHNAGWVINILTDRFWRKDDWSIANTWLNTHDIYRDHFNLVRAEEKPVYAQQNNISVFVEDNIETAIRLSTHCEKVFLMDKTYNKGDLPKNVHRIKNWKKVLSSLP